MRTILLSCCVIALAGFGVRAASVDDVIEMAKKGETEEKQVAAVEATTGEITIGATEVLRLRDAKISEKVIMAILRHVATDKAATANAAPPVPPPALTPIEPVAPPPDKPVAPAPEIARPPAPVVPNGLPNGYLTIDNLDDRPWSYMYEPAIQTIWIAPPGNGSVVQGHSSTTVSMRVGSYKFRFIGTKEEGLPMTIFGGERSAISLSRVTAEAGDTLNASIFEHGERKTSGKLVVLNNLPPQEVVVEHVVETPVYYYSDSPYYYYYGGGYYPYYHYHGGHSGYSYGYSGGSGYYGGGGGFKYGSGGGWGGGGTGGGHRR